MADDSDIGPWQDYQAAEESGPWQDYQAAEESGPWQDYQPSAVAVAPPDLSQVRLSPYQQADLAPIMQAAPLGFVAPPSMISGKRMDPEQEERIVEEAMSLSPFRAIPRIEGKTTLGKLAAAPVNVGVGVLQGVVSPITLATLPFGGPVVKGLFGGLAAKAAGEQLGQASVTGDVQQVAEGVLGAGLAPAIALHRTLPVTRPAGLPPLPPEPPPITGEALKMPRGSPPVRRPAFQLPDATVETPAITRPNEIIPTPSEVSRPVLPSSEGGELRPSVAGSERAKPIPQGKRPPKGPVEERLLQALSEAEDAFRKSGLSEHVRYADTVANTRGTIKPGGAPLSKDAMELRIIQLQAAKDYFNKHAGEAAPPPAPETPPVAPAETVAKPVPEIPPESKKQLKLLGLRDADISDLESGKSTVGEIVDRKLPGVGEQTGGGPDHARALEEARQQARMDIERILSQKPVPEPTAAPVQAAPTAAKEPWQSTRSEFASEANRKALESPELPPRPPPDYDVLDAIEKKLNRRPYNPDLLTDSALGKLGDQGLITGSPKKIKFTEEGRSKLLDWRRRSEERRLAEGDLADKAVDAATDEHKASVEQALHEGKPVPPEVLADYPDLQKPPPPAAPAAGEGKAPKSEADKSTGHVSFVGNDEYYIKGRTLHRAQATRPIGKSGVRKSSFTTELKGGKIKSTGEDIPTFIARIKAQEDAFTERMNAQIREFGRQREAEHEAMLREWEEKQKPKPTPSTATEKAVEKVATTTIPDIDLTYRAPATGKKSRWIRKDGLWYKSKNLSGEPVLQKTPLESSIGLASALDQQASNPKPWQRVRVLQTEEPKPAAETAPPIGPGAPATPDHGIAASVRRKWTSATDDSPLGSEAGFVSLAPLRDIIDYLGPKVRASIAAVKEAVGENFDIRRANDYRRAVFNWSAKLQRSFGEAASAQREIRSKVTDPIRRAGITNWIQAGGDMAELARRKAATEAWRDPATGKPHPQQKQLVAGYDAALNLTPEEIAVANEVKTAFDDLHARGTRYDVLHNFLDNYVTQQWDLGKSPKGMGTSRKLRDRFRFDKARKFGSYFEGEQAGYVPKTKDISSLLPMYLHEMNSVIAARQLVQDMSKGFASDGRPLLAPRGVGVAVDGPKGKATLLLPDVPRGVKVGPSGAKTKMDTSDYVFLESQPALHEWVYAAKDSAGNPVFNRADLVVHPEVAARFKNALGRSAIREWYESRTSAAAAIPKAIVQGIDLAQSETKKTMLGLLTPFHQVQEGTHAVGHKVNPFFNNPEIDLVNNPAQMDAARHGLMLLPDRASAQNFMEGFRQSGLVTHLPGIGPLADHYSYYLFHEYIPGIKYKTYEAILKRNTARYANDIAAGKATLEDVKILSAEQANAAYGHLNYADLGRNPTIQHLMRLGLLAPDFLEARMRFAGQALEGLTGGKVGREQLIALATLAVAQASLSWMSAQLTGGQWDAKDPFTFHVGNRKFTMRSVPEDLYRSVKDHRAFWYARLNPLIGRGVIQYMSGTDWRGQKVSPGQTTKELLQQPVPLALRPLFGIGNTPLSGWEEIAGAAGLKISRYSAWSEMNKVAHDWMAKSDDPKIKAAEERYQHTTLPDSDYKPLRESLIKKDMRGARKAYARLLLTKTPEQISTAMNSNRPFTGSREAEKEFLESLTPEQTRLYDEAQSERQRIHNLFELIEE